MSISGKFISLKIGGVTPVVVPGVTDLTADTEADELDGTTAEDDGFDNPDDGCKRCVITGTLVIDINTGSFVSLSTGTLIQDLKYYADIDATSWIFHLPVAKVFRASFKGAIKGRATYDVTIKSKGVFYEQDPSTRE